MASPQSPLPPTFQHQQAKATCVPWQRAMFLHLPHFLPGTRNLRDVSALSCLLSVALRARPALVAQCHHSQARSGTSPGSPLLAPLNIHASVLHHQILRPEGTAKATEFILSKAGRVTHDASKRVSWPFLWVIPLVTSSRFHSLQCLDGLSFFLSKISPSLDINPNFAA